MLRVTSADLLADGFGRIRVLVHTVVDGLGTDDLAARVDPDANSIAWLVWHLTRIQDDHVAGVAGAEQAWTADGWADRFGLPFDAADHGYGHSARQVGAVRVAGELLTGYHDAVYQRTLDYVGTVTDADLPRVVDTFWDPPVTLAVRLVSVINDSTQHVGQASYASGILRRR